jgi:hypothetical protein
MRAKYTFIGGFILRYAFQRKTLFMIILFCATAGILVVPVSASADVTSWELSTDCPSVGDVIKISGEAAPKEIIKVSILHEELVPVSEGSYTYQIDDLTIPKPVSGGDNSFKVNATGENGIIVKDMNIGVKKFKNWFSKNVEVKDGSAIISQSNVPSWMSYVVKINGEVEGNQEGSVKLVFESEYEAAKADKKGNFKFSYNTDSLPAGDYIITIGDDERKFTLNPAEEKDLKVEKKVKGC